MKLSYKIPAALLGVAATLALVQPQIAVGLSPEEVGKIAQEITVRIDGLGDGSGAIVPHPRSRSQSGTGYIWRRGGRSIRDVNLSLA
ncbi:MAG: hypothetical protein AB4352_14775 [Hormoscilla sp.]